MEQFEQCIKEGNIVKIEIDPEKVSRELKEAEFDLEASERSASEKVFKWTTIQGHYSLQHSFNALLFSKGYCAIGHQCLLSGINKFFTPDGLIDNNYIKDFEYSHKVSEGGDHPYNNKEDFAIHILNSAGDVLEIAQNILGFED
jgi:uncharacterized protein (UPF0332 family)